MKVNQAGLDLIKQYEGCKLEVYKDLVGLRTVGYGHRTLLAVGTKISQQDAEDLLARDVQIACNGLTPAITVPLTDNQFSAIVSLAFNVGVSAVKSSTLLKLVNASDFSVASEQFERWDRAGGKEVTGLLKRRLAEKSLFLT